MNKLKKILLPVKIPVIIYSVLFAIMCVADRHIVNKPEYKTTILTTYIDAFESVDILILPLIAVTVYVLIRLIQTLLPNINIYRSSLSAGKRECTLYFFIFTVIIILAWIPYLMSYWPGGVYNDTFDSISIALGRQEWDNQNTVLYVLFWKLIFRLGEFVNQGDYGGLKLMTVVQPIIMITVAASFFSWLIRRGVKKWIAISGVLVFAFAPIFPFYGISLWKDTLFSVVIFLYSWLLYVIINDSLLAGDESDENKYRIKTSHIIKLTVISILVVFGRNNGIYIVIVTSVFLILYMRKRLVKSDFTKLLCSLIVVILSSIIIKGPVYSSIGIRQSAKVEQYGIPLQQVGYMISASASMSEKDRQIIEGIMPIEAWINLYNPIVVDTMKFDPLFNREYFNSHTGDFLKAYVHMVISNPVLAIKGYMLATLGFWDLWQSSSSSYICTEHCWNSGYFMSDYFNVYTGKVLSDIVGPRWYISAGLLAWIMLGIIVLLINQTKKRSNICVVLPTLSLWLTLMIATPLAFSFRYVFSLLLCIPLYLLLVLPTENKVN